MTLSIMIIDSTTPADGIQDGDGIQDIDIEYIGTIPIEDRL